MTGTSHRSHPVRVEEDIGALRRAVGALAARLPGLPRGDAELVATELATNVLRHTTGGYVLVREAEDGVELIAVDHGSGTAPAHVPRSSARMAESAVAPSLHAGARAPRFGETGLGVGLAGVRRRASAFDHYTSAGGTVVLAHLRPASSASAAGGHRQAERWRWGGVNVPLGGSGESGDAWSVIADGYLVALVVDGLGHGPDASEAARAAVSEFGRQLPRDPGGDGSAEAVRRIHTAMLGTRGGVLGMCLIDPDSDRVTYTGVGNISGQILNGRAVRRMLGHPGTLGTHLQPPRIRPDVHPWSPGSTLVLTSDGIRTHWDTDQYPGLLERRPAVVAAVLHRDHARGRDDATVLVVQDRRGRHQEGDPP